MNQISAQPAPSSRTQVRRQPSRGAYDLPTVFAVLDAVRIGHIGFIDPAGGAAVVIPTLIARADDHAIFHTLRISRLAEAARAGEICLSATIEDGLVLAKSAFHHSMNYRSVIAFGRAREISDDTEKMQMLFAFTEKVVPGRWPAVRPPNAKEMAMTSVFALPLTEASAKSRSGGPNDDVEDLAFPAPTGVIPILHTLGEIIPADGPAS